MPGFADQFEIMPQVDFTSTSQYHLMRWLKKNDYMSNQMMAIPTAAFENYKKCPGIRISFLDGYIAFFPMTRKEEVLDLIAKDIATETPLAISQIAYFEEGARLVVDADSTRMMTDEEILRFSTILNETLAAYFRNYDTNPIDIFVSKCGPRIKKNKNVVSMHCVCHVSVSFEDAQQLIYGYLHRLKADPRVDLTDITIDMGIYEVKTKSVHLRLIYSSKMEKCLVCNNDENVRKHCLFCDNRGRIRSKFSYVPMGHLRGIGSTFNSEDFKETHKDWNIIVRNHSIWSSAQERRTDYLIPIGEPRFETKEKLESQKIGHNSRSKKACIQHNNTIYEQLQEEIRSVYIGNSRPWDKIIVDRIEAHRDGAASVFVSGIGASFCLYASKDHGTRNFWFSLSRRHRMTLRCSSVNSSLCKDGHRGDDTRICFDISGDLGNDIFGIQNMPSFDACEKRPREDQEDDILDHLEKVYRIK